MLLQLPRAQQPPEAVALASPFRKRGNLLFLGARRGIYGASYAESGAINWTPTAGGIGAQPATTSDYINAGRVRLLEAAGAGILIAFVPRTTSQRGFGGHQPTGNELEQVLLNTNSSSDPSAGRLALVLRDAAGGLLRFATTNSVLTTNKLHVVLFEVLDGQNGRITLDGVDQAVTHANSGTYGGSGLSAVAYDIGNLNSNGSHTSGGGADILLFARLHGRGFDRFALTRDMRGALSVVEPRRIWVPMSAGGATSHATSGALSADAAAIAGTAAHLTLHATSGALASDAASIAGTATHLTLHATSGALASDAAVIAGAADHAAGGEHPTDGALSADAAVIAGTAAHLTLHTTTGALTADAATVAGTAAHLTLHATSGALASDPATMAGVAVHSGAGATAPMTGAGRPSRSRRPRVVEIDGEDFVVNSDEEAVALLDQAREAAKERAATAVKRAAEAKRRPVGKVVKDARRLLVAPAITASGDLQELAEQAEADIAATYASAIASVEIAALLAKRQREEEDDEDVLLLIA